MFSFIAENYLDQQEDKKVHEESLDYKNQRDEVVKLFQTLRTQLVTLLEENIREPPLHQLSLSEFNLHLENKKERLKAVTNFLFTVTPLNLSCIHTNILSDYKYDIMTSILIVFSGRKGTRTDSLASRSPHSRAGKSNFVDKENLLGHHAHATCENLRYLQSLSGRTSCRGPPVV